MGLASLLAGIVNKSVEWVEDKFAEGAKNVAEDVDSADNLVERLFTVGADVTKKLLDTAKSGVDMAALLAKQKADQAVIDALKASEDALKAVDDKVNETTDIVSGILDFLKGGVERLVGGAIDAVNWLTDMIMHPDRFITWLSNVVAGLW